MNDGEQSSQKMYNIGIFIKEKVLIDIIIHSKTIIPTWINIILI